MKNETIRNIKKQFKNSKILEITKLSKGLNYSVSSMRKYLKSMGYYRSVSDNGKFYTLKTIPDFNQAGLWEEDGKIFSNNGNLHETIVFFIEQSTQGLSSKELSEILGLSCTVTLNKMKQKQLIGSLTSKGKHIYISNNSDVSSNQIKLLSLNIEILPSLEKSIIILVTIINNNNISNSKLLELLRNKGLKLSISELELFLKHYDIQKKTLNN
jgi:predicted transcriptional regulator